VTLFMISFAIVVGIVSMLPAFIHVRYEKLSVEQTLAPLEAAIKSATSTVSLADVKKQADILAMFNDDLKGKIDYSYVIGNVVDVRGPVKITSIAVSKVSTTTVTVSIQGIAPNREALLTFKSRLENAAVGNRVELPISQLAKSSNIPFSLTVSSKSIK